MKSVKYFDLKTPKICIYNFNTLNKIQIMKCSEMEIFIATLAKAKVTFELIVNLSHNYCEPVLAKNSRQAVVLM